MRQNCSWRCIKIRIEKKNPLIIVTKDFFDTEKNPPTDKKILDMIQAIYEKMIKDRGEKLKSSFLK